ncbi:MAG: hypothetical protein IJ111_07270, partial [Eggerthellaceae bacterium]|nr:hypothetical protein [Eggerthellaceae bacterium]
RLRIDRHPREDVQFVVGALLHIEHLPWGDVQFSTVPGAAFNQPLMLHSVLPIASHGEELLHSRKT